MRLRTVRNLRRGDRVAIDQPHEAIAQIVSVDTADTAGWYGVKMVIEDQCRTPVRAVWPGDDLIELA